MTARAITAEETDVAQELLDTARRAMAQVAEYDQAAVDRMCQSVAWASALSAGQVAGAAVASPGVDL